MRWRFKYALEELYHPGNPGMNAEVCACVRACVRACACVRVCVCVELNMPRLRHGGRATQWLLLLLLLLLPAVVVVVVVVAHAQAAPLDSESLQQV